MFVCVTSECALRYTTVVVERLDAEVVEQFFTRLADYRLTAPDDGDVQQAQEEVERLPGEVERLAAVVPSHPAAVVAHQRALAEVEARLAEAEDRRDELVAATAQRGPDVRELRTDWPTLALDEQREILRAGIDAVLVRRASGQGPASVLSERALVLYHGEAPEALKSNRQPVSPWSWNGNPESVRAAGV